MAQAVLFRGAGLDAVWPQFLALGAIGTLLFLVALLCFRKAIREVG
jgi:ABC-2 type transport system permease protein